MRKSWLMVFILLLICGCGYTTGSLLPAHIKSVAVPTFTNKTYEPGLETDITRKVIERFIFDGNLKIATEEKADVILLGEVVGYERVPLRYKDNDIVEEYRVVLTVNLIFKDLVKNKVIWEEKEFKGEYTYYTSAAQATGAAGTSASSETEAREKAILDLARNIVNRTVEGW